MITTYIMCEIQFLQHKTHTAPPMQNSSGLMLLTEITTVYSEDYTKRINTPTLCG
jgi:hypothetical protein